MMTLEAASYIIRRKPQNKAEYDAMRVALHLLQDQGMSKAEIEREAMRSLSFPEELFLAEFR